MYYHIRKIYDIILVVSLIFSLSSCDKEINTTPPEEPPPQGFIFVDSNPQNYKIYLDGRFTGRFTPDTLRYVEETEHLIELKRKYWLDSSAVVISEKEILKSIYIDFIQNPKIYGTLKLSSIPENATVEINDSLTTIKTPYVLTGLLPGLYKIEYHLEQHRSLSTKIAIESNITKTVSLALQDTSIWVDFTESNSDLPNNSITTLAVDKNNKLFAGTVSGGVVMIKGSKWENINSTNSVLPSDRIRVIEVDKNNTIWIGTDEGLAEYKNNTFVNVYDNTKLKNDIINVIDFFDDKTVVGTADGLLQIGPDGLKLVKIMNDDGETNVWAIEIDEKSGNVWVGVTGRMITYKIKDGELNYDSTDADIGTSVFDLELTNLKLRPADGELWALFSSLTDLNEDEEEDEREIIHVAPYITVWNGNKWLWKNLWDVDLFLTDITVDKDNIVWITTNLGLRRHESIKDYTIIQSYNTGLFEDDLTAVEEDKNGTLWIGSYKGLYKYKKNQLP